MSRNPLAVIILLTIVPACSLTSGACGSGIEPAPPPEEPTVKPIEEVMDDTPAPPVQKDVGPVTKDDYDGPGPYDCEDAANCTKTCGGGVLNRLWAHAHKDKIPQCKDGCAGKSTGKPICVDGECVATDRDGNVVDHCTKKMDKIDM